MEKSGSLNSPFKQLLLLRNNHCLWLVVYGCIALLYLKDYLSSHPLHLVLGGLSFYFITGYQPRPKRYYRFAVAALCCMVMGLLVPVKTVLWFALGFCVLFFIEAHYSRVGWAGFLTIILMSPVCVYLSDVFSFPIRLFLSGVAGQVLHLMGNPVVVAGNTIQKEGNEFTVDPACMGLNMVITSLLLGIMLLGFYQKKGGLRLPLGPVLVYGTGIFFLNLLANLLRMVLLVQFSIMPGTAAHEWVGLLCLAVYVVVPATAGAKYGVQKWGKPLLPFNNPFSEKWPGSVHLLLVGGLLLTAVQVEKKDTYKAFAGAADVTVPGYTSSLFAPGIVKLQNNHSLIYVKYIRGFYDTDHNPTICWQGSGYALRQVQKKESGSYSYYTARLEDKSSVLYTAWWYGNGQKSTVNQLAWRYDLLKGAPGYAVINVTAASEETLLKELQKIWKEDALNRLFTQFKKEKEEPVKPDVRSGKGMMDRAVDAYRFTGMLPAVGVFF